MIGSQHKSQFAQDKNLFFTQLDKIQWCQSDGVVQKVIQDTDKLVSEKSYDFLFHNIKPLETEFINMFVGLKKKKIEHHEPFWIYCYYCASLLESFYKSYEQQAKEQEYHKKKLQIKNYLLNLHEKEEEDSFIKSLETSFSEGFRAFLEIPYSISKVRNYIAYSNLCRLYWIFCRLTLTNGFLLAEELKVIEKIDAVLGTHTDVKKIISIMHAPNNILNYFSVALFVSRFLIDAGLLIKHTFFPGQLERSVPAFERFKYELSKRQCNFANDLVWATVNFLTNFSHITKISAPIAGGVTVVFLGFDVGMVFYGYYLAKREYLAKKSQYQQEINDSSGDHLAMLLSQYSELEINWKTKEATCFFTLSAAALLMSGFASALFFSPPGLIVSSFFMCVVAAAMYCSTESYSKYKETGLRALQSGLKEVDDVAHKNYEVARDDFVYTMVKRTVIPSILITTLAIYWPAALAFTALYLGYELFHSYDQHSRRQEIQCLASVTP